MKKNIFLIVWLSTITLFANAQFGEPKFIQDVYNFGFVPYALSSDGSNLPHCQTADNQVDVYTNSFDLLKSVSVKNEIVFNTRDIEKLEILDITFDDKFLTVSADSLIIPKIFTSDEDFMEYIKTTYSVDIKAYGSDVSNPDNYNYYSYICATDTIVINGLIYPITAYVVDYYDNTKVFKVEYEYTYDEYYDRYKSTQVSSTDMTQYTTDISQFSTQDIINFLNLNSWREYIYVETSNGNWFVENDDSYFFRYEKYGTKYPLGGYKVINNKLYGARYQDFRDDNGTYHYFESEGVKFIFGDNTTYLRTDTTNYYRTLASIYFLDINTGTEEEGFPTILTQKLFNSDADYEYVTMIPKTFQYVTTNESYYGNGENLDRGEAKITYNEIRFSGFNVVAENGNNIAAINFPDNFSVEGNYCQLIHIGDNYFLLFAGILNYERGKDQQEYANLIYKVTSAPTGVSVQQVGNPIHINVTPTILDRSQDVNISLSDESMNHEVRVSDIQGRTIERRKIPSGQKTISIPAHKMNNGMNIISVMQNQEIIDSKKIIVK